MSRVEVVVCGELPSGLQVGDTFPLSATARVVGVQEELVDGTSYGRPAGSVVLPGERTVTILVDLAGAAA